MRTTPSGRMPSFRSCCAMRHALLERAVLVANVPPTLLVLPDDAVVVAALVRTAEGLAIARARFGAQDTAAVEVHLIGSADLRVTGGVLRLLAPEDPAPDFAAPIAAAVLWLADGSRMTLGETGGLVAGVLTAVPVPPGAMVAGHHAPLILACDPRLGPFMAEM